MASNIWVSRINARLGRHLTTAAVIRSKPGDFFREYFYMVNLISLGIRCLTGRVNGNGTSRYLRTVCIFFWFI